MVFDIRSADEIASSRSKWGEELSAFCRDSASYLREARRLPIWESAISLATTWLGGVCLDCAPLSNGTILLLIGDEHLEEACRRSRQLKKLEFQFIYDIAFREWCRGFRDEAGWWTCAYWSINNPFDIVEFTRINLPNVVRRNPPKLEIRANETFLLTEHYNLRGTYSLCEASDDGLVVEEMESWADSV